MFTLIFHESQYVCDGDECVICFVEFVLSSKDSSELFDITEITLDNISSFIQFFIVCPRLFPITLRRKHINATLRYILQVFGESGIDTLTKIRRETVERWIAKEIQRKVFSPRTINYHLTSIKSFAKYLTDVELLPSNPLQPIRKLNESLDQRKQLRAMTAEEVE